MSDYDPVFKSSFGVISIAPATSVQVRWLAFPLRNIRLTVFSSMWALCPKSTAVKAFASMC
jgi:hypothetical protein